MNKLPHPQIKRRDWITVGNREGVVLNIYPDNSETGFCEITYMHICNKATRHDVDGDGTNWFFPERNDFGGYVKESDLYLQILKLGR